MDKKLVFLTLAGYYLPHDIH